MTKFGTLLLVALAGSLALSGCKNDPHTYKIQEGVGVIRYSPERGVYREGQSLDASVERLWIEANVAFEAGEWGNARNLLQQFRFEPEIVDSGRAFDAVLLESVVELESGRSDRKATWRLHDLANAWLDSGIDQSLVAGLPENLLNADGVSDMKNLGLALADSGSIERAYELQDLIFEHYSNGLGAVPSKLNLLSKQMRNCAWFAYVGGEYGLSVDIARDLLKRAPRAEVRSTTQLILAQSYVKSDRHDAAVKIYQGVFDSARDPDLKEEALYGEITALISSSKGWEYDRQPYENALEKVTEYKTGFLTLYPDAKMVGAFSEIERRLHDVLYRKDKEAAQAYKRLFEPDSSRFYLDVAGRRRDAQINAEKALRRDAAGAGK